MSTFSFFFYLCCSEKDSVGVVSYADESSVVSEPLVVSQKYCRCNFTYSGGSCEVVCGPNDLINVGNSVHLSQSQRSAAAAVTTTTTTAAAVTLNQPEVTSVVTAAVVLANSANDPAAPKI